MRKPETQRIVVTLPDNVYRALKKVAAYEEVPQAAIVRHALVEWLRGQGVLVQDNVFWGGSRYVPRPRGEDENEEGQKVAVVAG